MFKNDLIFKNLKHVKVSNVRSDGNKNLLIK